MASFHGKHAKAFFSINGGTSFTEFTNVRSWTCTLNAETADTTGMAATTGRTRVPGVNNGTCSIECVYDDASYVQVDESDNDIYVASTSGIAIELLRDATDASKGYAGGAQCTGVEVGTSIDGTPIITYNFEWVSTVSATVTSGTP